MSSSPEGTHYIVQGNDVSDGGHVSGTPGAKTTPDRNPDLYSIYNGDVLFSAKGSLHRAYLVREIAGPTVAAGSFYIFRVRTADVRPDYLTWWINQPPTQAYLQRTARATIISYVTKSVMEQMPVVIPPLQVQLKIVEIHALWNAERGQLQEYITRRSKLIECLLLKAAKNEERQ